MTISSFEQVSRMYCLGGECYHKSNTTLTGWEGKTTREVGQRPFLGREWPGIGRTEHLLKQPIGLFCLPCSRYTRRDGVIGQPKSGWFCWTSIGILDSEQRTATNGHEENSNKWGQRRRRTTKSQKNKKVATKVRGPQHSLPTSLTDERKGGKMGTSTMEKRVGDKFPSVKKDWIAIWNSNYVKFKWTRVAEYNTSWEQSKNKWDVVLSEISPKVSGIWWYEDSSVVVHGKRAPVVLRNQWAMAWKKQGSQKWLDQRIAMVT